MSFKVGQKVVCFNPVNELVNGEIYVVKSLSSCTCGNSFVDVGIEAKNRLGTYCSECKAEYFEVFFNTSRFRPIDYSFGEKVTEEIAESILERETVGTN